MLHVPLWLYLLTFYYSYGTTKGDWVDPHSMDTNIKEKIRDFTKKSSDINTEYCAHVINCNSDLYLRRIVRIILNNAYLDKEDLLGDFSGHLNIKLSSKEYKFLINFSLGDESREEVYSEVNSIFENAIQKTSFDKFKETILSLEEKLHLVFINPTTYVIVFLCLTLYVTYKLLTANFTLKIIVKFVLFFGYLIDFMITYLKILRDEEINNIVAIKKLGTVPPECDPQKLSWWQYMKTQFESAIFENPCKAYYHATFNNYKYLVTPTKVLTLQFRTIIVEPIGDLGEAFGKFGRRMFSSLPWGLNIAIFPLMLITLCAIIFVLLLFITKPHFKLSLFHLFTIEMGQPAIHGAGLNTLPGPNQRATREVGNKVKHRALVEDASNSSFEGQLDANQENDTKYLDANDKKTEESEGNTVIKNLGSADSEVLPHS